MFFHDLRQCAIAVLLFVTSAGVACAAEFDVTGIDDGKLRKNVELHLSGIDDDVVIADPVWQKIIKDTVSTALEPYGYYNSETQITQGDDSTVRLTIDIGTPLVVANVTREIIGDGRFDPVFREEFDSFPLHPGDVLDQPTYSDFKSSMFSYALSHGYFDFFWQATRLDLVREEREANILLVAQSGPRYQFGEVRIIGDDRARAIINQLRPFEVGQAYTAELLTRFNRRLNEAGYFERVIARPVVNQAINKQVPIEVTVTHLPKDTFNVGGGFSTDMGPRGRLRWERPWFNNRGHSATTQLFVSRPQQSVSVDYRIPMRDVTHDYASIIVGYEFFEENDTDSESFSVAAKRYTRQPDSPYQRIWSLTYQRALFTQANQPSQTTQLLMPGYALSFIEQEGELDITNGSHFLFSFEGGYEGVGSDISVLKATAKAKWIRTLGKHRFTARAEAGVIETDEFDRVPPTMRFFAGGDQSIRGFAFASVGTRVQAIEDGEVTEPLIGDPYLVTGSVEYAHPIAPNWRAAVFADGGTATSDFDASPAVGIGAGVHYITIIGPVRFYLARGYSDFENTWRVHFALGPEL